MVEGIQGNDVPASQGNVGETGLSRTSPRRHARLQKALKSGKEGTYGRPLTFSEVECIGSFLITFQLKCFFPHFSPYFYTTYLFVSTMLRFCFLGASKLAGDGCVVELPRTLTGADN